MLPKLTGDDVIMARIKVARNISYDDKRKKYYVTFNLSKDETGHYKKSTKTYPNLKQAKHALKIFEGEKERSSISIAPNNLTFKQYSEYWLNTIKANQCEKTTLYGYKNILYKHLYKSKLCDLNLQSITQFDVNKYLYNYLPKLGLSKNTINKHFVILKMIFKQAYIDKKITSNPLEFFKPPKKESIQHTFYSEQELHTLLNIVRDTTMEIPIYLAGILGMRREEISGLQWDCINFLDKQITIRRGRTTSGKVHILKEPKNQSSFRILKMDETIYQLLLKQKQKQEKCSQYLNIPLSNYLYVVCKNDGNPYNPNYISNTFLTIIKNNNLKRIRFHDLRHSFASIAHEHGVSILEISKALGHSNISTTTKVYTHMFDITNENAINAVSDAVNQKS